MIFWRNPTFLSIAILIAGCSGNYPTTPSLPSQDGPPDKLVDVHQIPDATPRPMPLSKYGNPQSYVVFGKRYHVLPSSENYKERGIASWYGSKFHGQRTSSGEPYDMHAMTAAHKSLPLPTFVKVTNLNNGRKVILKVNDRGPFHDNRIIDLSHTAAVKLGIKNSGTGLVEVEAINPQQWQAKQQKVQPVTSSRPVRSTYSASLFLQLGAFISAQNAYNLKNQVNSSIKSQLAKISTISKNNQQFYRVRIGPIHEVERADQLAQTLTQKGFDQPRIVIE